MHFVRNFSNYIELCNHQHNQYTVKFLHQRKINFILCKLYLNKLNFKKFIRELSCALLIWLLKKRQERRTMLYFRGCSPQDSEPTPLGKGKELEQISCYAINTNNIFSIIPTLKKNSFLWTLVDFEMLLSVKLLIFHNQVLFYIHVYINIFQFT